MKETIERRLVTLQDSVKLRVNFCRSHANFYDAWAEMYSNNQEVADAYRMAADNLRFISDQLYDAWQLSMSE